MPKAVKMTFSSVYRRFIFYMLLNPFLLRAYNPVILRTLLLISLSFPFRSFPLPPHMIFCIIHFCEMNAPAGRRCPECPSAVYSHRLSADSAVLPVSNTVISDTVIIAHAFDSVKSVIGNARLFVLDTQLHRNYNFFNYEENQDICKKSGRIYSAQR